MIKYCYYFKMSSLADYTVTINLVNDNLLICNLINDEQKYESIITQNCLKSGMIKTLEKLEKCILINAREIQPYYTIRIDHIDSYNLVLNIIFSNDVIEFEEQIIFTQNKHIKEYEMQISTLTETITVLNNKIENLEKNKNKSTNHTYYENFNTDCILTVSSDNGEIVFLSCNDYVAKVKINDNNLIFNANTNKELSILSTSIDFNEINYNSKLVLNKSILFDFIDYYLTNKENHKIEIIYISDISLIDVLIKHNNYNNVKFNECYPPLKFVEHCLINGIKII